MSFEVIENYIAKLLVEAGTINPEVILFFALLVVFIIVLDRFDIRKTKKQIETGIITPAINPVSVDGSKTLPTKAYISEMQGLAGRPDAIIIENGFLIPVERKPLAKKMHDRYIAQLLVYMRLIEEFEGKKPPYGYLVIGPKSKKIRIDNTDQRQSWLLGLISEMNGILNGKPAIPAPHPRKCSRCSVSQHCTAKVTSQ